MNYVIYIFHTILSTELANTLSGILLYGKNVWEYTKKKWKSILDLSAYFSIIPYVIFNI